MFKHDDPPNNTNQFDVDKSLNKNWDKIDDFATKTDESVIDLKVKCKELGEENQRLREDINSLPSGQAKGENITINDSAEARFKEFNIKGNSYQETRSGKNLFNIENVNAIAGNPEGSAAKIELTQTGFIFSKVGTGRYSNTVKCDIKAGNYLFCCKITGGENFVHGLRMKTDNNDNSVILIRNEETALNLVSDIQSVQFYVLSDESEATIQLDDIMIISADEQDKSYEAYGAMPSPKYPSKIRNCGDNGNINFKIENKNLIDINKFESSAVTRKNNTSITANFTGNFQSAGRVDIPLSNKKYLVSIELSPSSTTGRIELRLSKNGIIVDTKMMYTTYLIDNSNGEYDSVGITLSNGTYIGELTFNKPQLEIVEDNTTIPTEYILHQEQNISFLLKEGQVLHKGDYLADDGVHHTKNTIELEGTEDWSLVDKEVGQFSYRINNYKKDTTLCNYFKIKDSYRAEGKPYLRTVSTGIYAEIGTAFLNEVSVDAWKAYLSKQKEDGTPVKLEYKLTEEIVEAYSEEQQEVYNKIKNIKSHKNTTNIYSEDEVSPTFEVEYIKDLETLITKG